LPDCTVKNGAEVRELRLLMSPLTPHIAKKYKAAGSVPATSPGGMMGDYVGYGNFFHRSGPPV